MLLGMSSSPASPTSPAETPTSGPDAPPSPVARRVLIVLTIVYVFNFIDRQILSILAEDIKADTGITDGEMGFLYGTAFAVFYAVFGIPLGRLADVWVRRSLIAIGLAFWSLMTALSGTARGFATLATFRIGVGVGEASASPAAYSLLSDWFPPRLRATALGIYSSGVYIGAGVGLFLGGFILDSWAAAYPDGTGPFGLRGWQAAFFIVGTPGILLAVVVRMLPEPVRGQSEGLPEPEPNPHPFREFGRELLNVVPPFTVFGLLNEGAGRGVLLANLGGALAIALGAYGLIELTGSIPQWVALGIGLYAAVSWAQALALRDPPTFAMIFRSKALLFSCTGFACIAFVSYGIGFWSAPFFIRVHEASPGQVGMALGLASALGGWAGVTLGGVLSDRWRRSSHNARLWTGVLSALAPIPLVILQLTTPNLMLAYAMAFGANLLTPMWLGPASATVNELVLPRMRAVASAFYLLLVTFIGLALGPYTIGQVSDALVQAGREPGDGLRLAMLGSLVMVALAVACLLVASRSLPDEETRRLERARAAGEPAA